MATVDTSIINTIIEQFKALAPVLQNVVQIGVQLPNFAQLGDPMAASIASINRVGQMAGVGPVVQAMTGFTEASRNFFEPLSRMGIGNLDVMGMREKQVASGLTEQQFTEILTRHAQLLASSGGPAQFVDRAVEVQQRLKEHQVMKTGIEVSTELNAAMLESAMNYVSLNDSAELTSEQLDNLANAAVKSVAELQAQSMLTGRSREALSQETQARLAETRSRMAMAHMTEEQRHQYARLVEMTRTLAPEIQELVLASARGARLTPEQQATLKALNATGPAASMLMQSARAMMQPGADAEQRARAEQMVKEARGEVSTALTSKQAYIIADRVGGELGGTIERMYAGTLGAPSIEAQRKRMGPGATGAQAEDVLLQKAQRVVEGKTPTGEPDIRQTQWREYMKLMDAGQTSLAAVFKQFDEFTIQQIHLYAKGLQFINEQLFSGNKTIEEKFQQYGLLPRQISQGVQAVTGMPVLQPSPENIPGPNQPMPAPTGGTTAPTGGSWFDNFKNFFTFNSGTHGVFGEWFNDFGPDGKFAKLHFNEAVVPFNDLSKFLTDTYESMPHLFQSIIADMESNKPTVSKLELPFEFSKVNTTFEKIQQEQQKAFNIFQGMVKPSSREFTSANDVAAKSFSTPRTKTVIKEPFNAADAMAAGLTGEMPRARTDAENAEYKKWIIGGQVGPDPTRKTPAKPKEGKLVSPELQKILEEGESGKAYEVTGESAEELHEFMQARMGKIKTPESGRLPSMSDFAEKMQEGMPKVEQGLSAAAKMVPEMAGITVPGSLGDVVGVLNKLHGTMTGMAASAKATERYNRTAADQLKKKSGSLV